MELYLASFYVLSFDGYPFQRVCIAMSYVFTLSVSVNLFSVGMPFQRMTPSAPHNHAFKDVGMRIVKGRPIQYIRCYECGLLLRKR